MDKFWASLRTGCIIVFAVIAFCVTGWIAIDLYEAYRSPDLWAPAARLLNQHKSHSARVRVLDLFGADADGVCVVWIGYANERRMRATSPPRFGQVIPLVVRKAAVEVHDTRTWHIFAVKGGQVLREYRLVLKSALDLDRGGDQDRCYGADAPLGLQYWPVSRRDERAMMIFFSPEQNNGG